MDPSSKRKLDERRLTGLKVGAVALTVAGLGAFAGLAAAGTDDPAPATPGATAGTSATPSSSASDAARAAEDDSFFDDQAQGGAVGGYGDQGAGNSGAAAQGGTAPGGGYGSSQGSTGGS